MPIEIIHATDFARMVGAGHFDFAASRLALAKLAGACRERGIKQAVLDLRAFEPAPEPIFSPEELASLVYTFHEMGFTKEHRLAVLYVSDPHHRAHLFAFIARLRGWNVAAFDKLEEALSWLAGGRVDEIDTQFISLQSAPARAGKKRQTGSSPMKRHLVSRHSAGGRR